MANFVKNRIFTKFENMLDGHIQEQTDICYETRADIGNLFLGSYLDIL